MTLKVLVTRVNQLDDEELPNYLVDLFEQMEKQAKNIVSQTQLLGHEDKVKERKKELTFENTAKEFIEVIRLLKERDFDIRCEWKFEKSQPFVRK